MLDLDIGILLLNGSPKLRKLVAKLTLLVNFFEKFGLPVRLVFVCPVVSCGVPVCFVCFSFLFWSAGLPFFLRFFLSPTG